MKKNNKEIRCFVPEEMPLPHGEQFAAAWCEFCNHRRELGHKLTPTATKRILNELGALQEADAVKAIHAAITSGWRKPYPREARNVASPLGRTPTRLVL